MLIPTASLLFMIVFAAVLLVLLSSFALVAWHSAAQLIYPSHSSPQALPQDYGLAAEKISFQNHAGLTLRGWFIPTPHAKGTIVFNHGYADNCTPDLIYAPRLQAMNIANALWNFSIKHSTPVNNKIPHILRKIHKEEYQLRFSFVTIR
jgi:hypothetical protein